MKSINPNDWANKRKAAMDKARQIREDRKNGDQSEFTFKPQLNKRPSFLANRSDSLDQLTGEVKNDYSNDLFEQPLPGNKNKNYDLAKLPSPGSDALGREMKKFPFGSESTTASSYSSEASGNGSNFSPTGYKSKFLQQYENRSQANLLNEHEQSSDAAKRTVDKEAEEIFMSSLRSDQTNSGNRRQGWNDDTTTSGFMPAGKLPPAGNQNSTRRLEKRQSSGSSSRSQQPQPQQMEDNLPVPRRTRKEWNQDTEVADMTLPPKVSPRVSDSNQRVNDNSLLLSQAQPKLSLLKSKIRRSIGASGSAGNLSNSNSTNNMLGSGSYQNQYDLQIQEGSTNSGPKTAPARKSTDPDSEFPSYQPSHADNSRKPNRRNVPISNNNAGSHRPNSIAYAVDEEDDDYSYDASRFDPKAGKSQSSALARTNPTTNSVEANNRRSRAGALPSTSVHHRDNEDHQHPDGYEQYNSRGSTPRNRNENNFQQTRVPKNYQNDGNPDPYAYADTDQDVPSNLPQMECPDCGRKFNLGPYEKHVKICSKVFLTKRKAFDSQKMRIMDNPELVQIVNQQKRNEKKGKKAPAAAAAAARGNDKPVVDGNDKNSKWKDQSNAFREAMKAAREVTKAIKTGAPLPPPVISAPDNSLIPCPHCGRRFSEKAADRHIPKCQNIKAKPTVLKRGAGGGGGVNGTVKATSTSSRLGKF